MIPRYMSAMCLIGHGGVEKLLYREDVRIRELNPHELLVKVTATAKNNTDRKVREGLYPTKDNNDVASFDMGGTSSLQFPRIQGADVVGNIVAVGSDIDSRKIGERGLLDFNIYATDSEDINLAPDYYGHGADGGYAEYIIVPSSQFYLIKNPELADAELASMGMCSYQTALHMLNIAGVKSGEKVLVTGASGGVGTALIQLCKIIGAIPYALSSLDKEEMLLSLGAQKVIDRSKIEDVAQNILKATNGENIDAVMDLLGGEYTSRLIDTMIVDMNKRDTYPRLSIAGASGGNVSEILWTKIYLYQVQIFGVSHGTRVEAKQLIRWIQDKKLIPVLHGTFKLSDLHKAEEYFVSRDNNFLGKIVIVPDSEWNRHGEKFKVRKFYEN
ncbi:MAG: zinc-binding dehydrogenase [Sulfurospirillaceae bacterium]|nr:zinc-binding dehydrogenase [Sulfurospirillaceae bacterium]